MTANKRVFVTGLSALNACGNNLQQTWESLLAGRSAIAPIENENIDSWPNCLGGELKDFKPAKMLPDKKLIKVISRQDAIGINAAVQAIEHSGLIEWRDNSETNIELFNETTGVYVGSPGNKYFQQYDFLPLVAKSGADMVTFAQNLFQEVHPTWLLRILPNNVLAYVGITYGFKGANHNVTNHAVGGMQALIEAAHGIRCGQIERAVVSAYDMGAEAQALYYYDKMGLISGTGLRPFSADQDGTVLAEGGAAIVLESEASVERRGAKCYGEILSMGSHSEGQGVFSLEEDGTQLSNLLERCLKSASVTPQSLEFVLAHGNGNPRSDRAEAKALLNVFGTDAQPYCGAFKWAMGHTLTASGLLDTVLACQSLTKQQLPGVIEGNLDTEAYAHLRVSKNAQSLDKRAHALIINRGFASMNSCVVVRACE